FSHVNAKDLADDETFWREIREAFTVSGGMINLDNGNISPSPRKVTEAAVHYTWLLQDNPPFMKDYLDYLHLPTIRTRLSRQSGCSDAEIASVRNTTEALDTVILGLPMEKGDEVLTTNHDYWAMFDALEQRKARDGIVINSINVPVPVTNMD